MCINRLVGEFIQRRQVVVILIAATVSLFCLRYSGSAMTESTFSAPAIQTIQESDIQIVFRALEEIGNERFEEGRALLTRFMVPDNRLMRAAGLITGDSYYREGGCSNIARAEGQYYKWLAAFPEDKLAPRVLLKMAEMYLRSPCLRRDGGTEFLAERFLLRLRTEYPDFESQEATDYLDAAQEVIAYHDLKIAIFYFERGNAIQAVSGRCSGIVEKRSRFTKLDEALWYLAISEEAEE